VTTSGGTQGFGQSLASIGDLDGDTVPELLLGVLIPGEVRVLSGATGAELYRVSGPGAVAFGSIVANLGDLDGDFGVGAPARTPNTPEGRVFVYSGAGGMLIRSLHGGGGGSIGASFPTSLARMEDLNGDGVGELLVGAVSDLFTGFYGFTNNILAILFSDADGSVLRSLIGPTTGGLLGEQFGYSVVDVGDIDGGGLADFAVGAPRFSPYLGKSPGTVRVFSGERSPGVYCTAKTNSLGCTPTIWADGSPSVTGNGFEVSAHSVLNDRKGFLLIGDNPAQEPFGSGFSCVGGVRLRLTAYSYGSPASIYATPDCSGAFYTPLVSYYLQKIGVGETVYMQYRYTDPGDPLGFGLTDAIRVDVLP